METDAAYLVQIVGHRPRQQLFDFSDEVKKSMPRGVLRWVRMRGRGDQKQPLPLLEILPINDEYRIDRRSPEPSLATGALGPLRESAVELRAASQLRQKEPSEYALREDSRFWTSLHHSGYYGEENVAVDEKAVHIVPVTVHLIFVV